MFITFAPTPFKTVHVTTQGIGPESAASHLKRISTKEAKRRGLGERISRRSHVIGNRVTVFDIYRKA
jgi:hypothetical protein